MKKYSQKRFMVLSCAVFFRECYLFAAKSPHKVDVKIIPQQLHDLGGASMKSALQLEIDAIDNESYDAILLLYGLCNNGIRHLEAKLPLVVPRAHDCITLFIGSREGYRDHFNDNPGTIYLSDGWMERTNIDIDTPETLNRQEGTASYAEYVSMYGEEHAKFIYDALGDPVKNYSKVTYIHTCNQNNEIHIKKAREWASRKCWIYEDLQGDLRLIKQLLFGEWNNEDFLIVEPNQRIVPSYDEQIIKADQ